MKKRDSTLRESSQFNSFVLLSFRRFAYVLTGTTSMAVKHLYTSADRSIWTTRIWYQHYKSHLGKYKLMKGFRSTEENILPIAWP